MIRVTKVRVVSLILATLISVRLFAVSADPAHLVTVHALDGKEIIFNADHLAGLATPKEKHNPKRLIHPDANCIVSMANGRFMGIKETCEEVHHLISKSEYQSAH